MSEAHHIAMLGTGFIADFYTGTLAYCVFTFPSKWTSISG